MSEAANSANPLLSPAFDKARRISRIVTALLAIGFWFTLLWIIALPLFLFWPDEGGNWIIGDGVINLTASLAFGPRAGAIFAMMLGATPSVLILRHGGRVFAHFAKGEVFATATITHIRAAAIWLMVAAIAPTVEEILFNIFAPKSLVLHHLDLRPIMLFFGIAVYVAAYVMAEARRIADDNASIV